MRALAGVVAMLLLVAGCGSDDETAMTIDWDLSQSHSMQDVDWPRPAASAIELEPIESVAIRLPGDRELTEGDAIKKLSVDRDGELVYDVTVHSKPRTVDDAHRLALRWCEEWELPTEKIDAWHAAGGKRYNVVAYDPRRQLAADGPAVSLKLLYSFDDERPVVTTLSFFWKPEREQDGRQDAAAAGLGT